MNAPPPDFEGSDTPVEGPATIFVSDPSVEADRLSTSLRGRGYVVIDVPLSLLLARVAVQIPSIILLDIDAEGALEVAARLREIPGGQGVDVLFLGNATMSPPERVTGEASGFLVRPVDVAALLDLVDELVKARRESAPISIPDSGTPSSPSARSLSMRVSSPPTPRLSGAPSPRLSGFPTRASMGPPSSPRRTPRSDPRRGEKLDEGLGLGAAGEGGSPALPLPALSPEIEQLLRAAEERSQKEPGSAGRRGSAAPSPEAEIDAVLPAELLEALDEPLDDGDDFDGDSALTTGLARRGPNALTPGLTAHDAPTNAPASAPGHALPSASPAAAPSAAPNPPPSDALSVPATLPPSAPKTTPPPGRGSSPAAANGSSSAPPVEEISSGEDSKQLETPRPPRPKPRERETVPPPFWRGARAENAPPTASLRPPSSLPDRSSREDIVKASEAPANAAPAELPELVTPGAALLAFATCVRSRSTGALYIEVPDGVRRILMRDGDVVTAASGLDNESLVAFLETRGDLSRDVAGQLRGRVPAFGRHAGAALVANGQISQDQLWPVLRAHAEWILGRTISTETGAVGFEVAPPPRLKTEPSVFGGATGAEVLIEVVRRTVPVNVALERLGGEEARIVEGSRRDLLTECALSESEIDTLDRLKGATLGELAAGPDHLGPTVYALVALTVLDVEKASARAKAARAPSAAPSDRWDEGALRAQVKTRLSLVREADYFTLLGVSSSATSYEIHRAYLELRRTLEPARVLNAATADLTDDLLLIIDVIEEAHDILRDQVRRERYRRAIEAKPPA